MRSLRVLLWKHWLVRRRRFVQTPVELVSPIVLFLLVFLFRSLFHEPIEARYDEAKNTEPFSLEPPHTLRMRVLYTPRSALTDQLMAEVGAKLGLRRLDHLPGFLESGYYPFSDTASIEEFSKLMPNTDAIVIFQNLNDSLPASLQYTIRMKDEFNVHTRAAADGSSGPHDEFGRVYEPFMRVQWAVDTSYLHQLTGADINQTLTLQEFPYSKTSDVAHRDGVCAVLGIISPMSLMLFFVFLMTRLMEERNSGIQELVKMVGVSTECIGASHVINVLPTGLAYALGGALLITSSATALLPLTSAVVIALMLLLHFLSVAAVGFLFAYLINTTQYMTTVALFLFIVMWVPVQYVPDQLPPLLLLLSGLVLHRPLNWCWTQLAASENVGKGIGISNIAARAAPYKGSVLLALFFMLLQSAIFFLLTWYVSRVLPGKHGQAMRWNFLFQPQFWTKKPKVEVVPTEEDELTNPEPQYFEPVPKGAVAGIQILGVTKRFAKHTALTNVTFDVLQGEITVLLGHNGAGKTTLMNIITGLSSPTAGRVLVHGMDASSQRQEVRALLGLCPQHNLFFPDLTVREHLMFFAMLKGQSRSQAFTSCNALLAKLNLSEKATFRTDQLSGGMKRRVQLACALAGQASVLVLDEPTSGLDVETRRELWDLLLSLRGEHTVLLTTHFMEEADALGDRMCALHAGRVRCHASGMFLKRAVGTGYRVSLTTDGPPDEPAITAVVRSAIPDATVRDQAMNTITYNLPANDSARFPQLFSQLEDSRARLGIGSMGVGKSTLEDVFLKLCSDVELSRDDDEADTAIHEVTYPTLSGARLYLRQVALLMMRQLHFRLASLVLFLVLLVAMPIALLFSLTHAANNEPPPAVARADHAAMGLDLYKDLPDRRVLYNIQYDNVLPVLRSAYKNVEFEKAADVAGAVLRSVKNDVQEYNKYLVGIELNDTHAKALYTTSLRHAAPAAVNLLSNALAARVAPASNGRAFTTDNQPVRATLRTQPTFRHPKDLDIVISYAMYIGFVIVAVLSSYVGLPSLERATGTRHIYYMCGCPPLLFWSVTLVAHLVCAVLTLVVPTVLAALVLEKDSTINQPGFLGALTVTMLLGVLAFLSSIYLTSTMWGEKTTATVVTFAACALGLAAPVVHMSLDMAKITSGKTYVFMTISSYLFPAHTLPMTVYKCAVLARANALCALNRGLCGDAAFTPDILAALGLEKCCQSSSNPEEYFSMAKQAPGFNWLVLIGQFVVYWSLLMLTEGNTLQRAREWCVRGRLPPAERGAGDPVVRAEDAYVEKAIALPKEQIPEVLLCHDVHKFYPSVVKKGCYAVRGISFSVKRGECFGLLGVNGAGKSTTFKMLTAEERPTRGTLFADHHFGDDTRQYMRSLSYCPQFAGVDGFLSGRANLELVLTLRGYAAAGARAAADSWIKEVGLEKYATRRVSSYSGGCARRLAAASTLCQRAPVALLDEPSAGVDPAARRVLHRALRRARAARALVVTSHSMDEMEALCDRIGIVSGGRLRALGSAAALRAQHGAGHALILRLRSHDATDGGGADALAEFKSALHRTFEDCALQDEHTNTLNYHVRDELRYSELFARMEALRQAHPILEDYSLNETTLEEVFISFAREGRTPAEV